MSESADENRQENDDSIVEVTPETTVNKVNESVCAVCSEQSNRICLHCGQYFCSQHYCVIHEMQTTSEPLVDDEGVSHKGRRIRLIGEGWPNAIERINDLSEEQLEERIAGLKKLLKQAIETTDYAAISIAAHEYVRDYKRHSRYVAAMKRREKLEQGAINLNNKKHKVKIDKQVPADIAALMKLGNLTYEQAVAMKAMLGKAKT